MTVPPAIQSCMSQGSSPGSLSSSLLYKLLLLLFSSLLEPSNCSVHPQHLLPLIHYKHSCQVNFHYYYCNYLKHFFTETINNAFWCYSLHLNVQYVDRMHGQSQCKWPHHRNAISHTHRGTECKLRDSDLCLLKFTTIYSICMFQFKLLRELPVSVLFPVDIFSLK